MTAEAFPMDWDDVEDLPDGDPDATWVDAFRGRRGQNLPGAPTAMLAAGATRCLSGPPPKAANASSPGLDVLPVAMPAEATRLGPLVPDAPADLAPAPAPRIPSITGLPESPTVAAYDEPIIEHVGVAVVEPAARRSAPSLPAIAPGALSADDMPSKVAVPVVRPESEGYPALRRPLPRRPESSASSLSLSSSASMSSGTAPSRSSASAVRQMPAEDLQAALRSPAAPSIPAVPTWAAQKTQMEGPGVWIDTDSEVKARGRTTIQPQKHVPTAVAPLPIQVPAVPAPASAPPRRRSVMNEVVPFALVLIAISLATAALVGAYL